MSSRSRTKHLRRTFGATLLLGMLLAGCSDIYYDRRETIALGAGDYLASGEVVQAIDPWPKGSSNRNIAFDGEKMQSAVQRYRTNKIPQPEAATTSSAGYQQQQPAVPSLAPTGPVVMSAPAAPVK
jgi:hypothetical protein